jgi:hypothetical protein
MVQTTYAELLERLQSAAFSDAFPEDGSFIVKTIKGRRYWYFQSGTGPDRTQKYAGPETPELLARIEHHRGARNDERERRALVSTLTRSFNLPRPVQEIADVVSALGKAGIFRLRAVLIGTVAYQTYPAMLGIRLPGAHMRTDDIDIAQSTDVSIAMEDKTPPVLEILKQADATFRAVPSVADSRRATSYKAKNGLRVDILTPNRGRDTATPTKLPALQADAQPLRFLDYLIRDPEHAVILQGGGVLVQVPQPARYAVHKLIVARRRSEGAAKRDKDLQQADELLQQLSSKRTQDLRDAWQEAWERGKQWRKEMLESLAQISQRGRDMTLRAVEHTRSELPGVDLTFQSPPLAHDFSRDIVMFQGNFLNDKILCAISREALDDHFGTSASSKDARVEAVRNNRHLIEQMARRKYLHWPVEEVEELLIKTEDVDKLKSELGRPAKRR